MKNIHVLPTDKPSELYINMQGILSKSNSLLLRLKSRHIYITSDEEIKEGDYFIAYSATIDKKLYISCASEYKERKKEKGKIILTTDQDLIKDGVQAIDDEFLEWLVNNPSCEEIEIFSQNVYSMGKWDIRHSTIIPKEETEQDIIMELQKDPLLKEFDIRVNENVSTLRGNKGNWQFERSSGYAGYRNKVTGEWIYEEDYLKLFSPTKEIEQKLYTEEEVKELLKKFAPHIRYNHKELPHTWGQVVQEWFAKIKNKIWKTLK